MSAIVHIVDDDPSFRIATGRLLRAFGYQVEAYGSAEQFLARPPSGHGAGCILLDVRMPGLDGPELQHRLKGDHVSLPIIFLTGHADISTTVSVIKAGAENLLTKPVDKEALIDAIERALSRLDASQALSQQLGPLQAAVSRLTPREREVFGHVVRGRTNRDIAHLLGASARTVKAHRQRVMTKMGAASLAQLVMFAERLGVLSAEESLPKPDATGEN